MTILNNKFAKYLFVGIASLLLTGALSASVSAEETAADTGSATIDDIGGSDLDANLILGNTDPEQIIISIINWVLGVLALVAVIILLVGGFQWMTAGGNEEKVEGAKKRLTAGLIGLVIILAAWGVSVYVIENLLNITNAEAPAA
ncbi:MAG: pilin [Patescibacteria group bacterium]|jgi:hypothetical protein